MRSTLFTNPSDGDERNGRHSRRARHILNGGDSEFGQVLPDRRTSDRSLHLLDEYVKVGHLGDGGHGRR